MKTKAAIVGVVLIGVVVGTAGQTASQTSPSNDALLTEVRGLRAELNQAAGTSIRTQLLVARLQLQEQRINTIAKQLTDVQTQRSGNEGGLAQMSSRQKQIEDTLRGQMASEMRQQLEREVASMKGPLTQMRQRSQELLAQESSLSGQLATEQSRWIDFNSRLDEIEREIRDRK
jgi:predicted  nucleic acid-binding Zn-ribbon protein